MFTIRSVLGLSNYGKPGAVSLFHSYNYAATRTANLEAKLGLPEKPKKPASPYLMFVKETYPEYMKMTPKPTFREIISKLSERWRKVDMETKTKMMNEFHEKLHKYPETMKQYYDSLTDAQRVQLEAAKQHTSELRKKRSAMEELKKLGKPSRPVSPFAVFITDQYLKKKVTAAVGQSAMKELSAQWKSLPAEEKEQYNAKYREASKVYEKKIAAWEEEMVRQGKESLIRVQSRPAHQPSKKGTITTKKTQTGSSELRSA